MSSDAVAFELRDPDQFTGGSLSLADGSTFDLAERLGGGGPLVLAASHELVEPLRRIPAVREVAVPEGATPDPGYAGMSAVALRDMARRRGLATGGRKDELAERLAANDAAVAAGDQPAAADPHPEDADDAGDGEPAPPAATEAPRSGQGSGLMDTDDGNAQARKGGERS